MNIVFLTTESLHHYYLINEFNKSYTVKKVFFQTKNVEPKPLKVRIKRWVNPINYKSVGLALLDRLLFGKERALERTFELKYLFNGSPARLDSQMPYEKIESFNNSDVVEKVKGENPDLIIVFGTEILKGEILRVAKLGIFNIHRSILPLYRGGGLPGWVFYNNDFKNIGTTVHVCSEKLDGGDIVGKKYYQLRKGDEIYILRAKTTALAVEILKEVIEKLKQGVLHYEKQDYTKTWSAKNMTLLKELTARRNFKNYLNSLT